MDYLMITKGNKMHARLGGNDVEYFSYGTANYLVVLLHILVRQAKLLESSSTRSLCGLLKVDIQ